MKFLSLYSLTNSWLTSDSTKLQKFTWDYKCQLPGNIRWHISLSKIQQNLNFIQYTFQWCISSHWVHQTCGRLMIFWVRIESASWVDKASFYLVQCPHQPHSLHQLAAFLLGKCEHHETDVLLSSNCINTKVDQLMSLHRGVSRHWSTVMYRNIKKESLG